MLICQNCSHRLSFSLTMKPIKTNITDQALVKIGKGVVEAQSGSTFSLTKILGQNARTDRALWVGGWKAVPDSTTTPTRETLPNMMNNLFSTR